MIKDLHPFFEAAPPLHPFMATNKASSIFRRKRFNPFSKKSFAFPDILKDLKSGAGEESRTLARPSPSGGKCQKTFKRGEGGSFSICQSLSPWQKNSGPTKGSFNCLGQIAGQRFHFEDWRLLVALTTIAT